MRLSGTPGVVGHSERHRTRHQVQQLPRLQFEESPGALLAVNIPAGERRNLRMVPFCVVANLPTGAGDYGPDDPMGMSGTALPMWSHLDAMTRGGGLGADELKFLTLVENFRDGIQAPNLIEFTDYQLRQQGWRIVVILVAGDMAQRIFTQGSGANALWLVELVQLAGPRRMINREGRPQDKIYQIQHLLCDKGHVTYNVDGDRST
jgi:hypothetical protein